MLPWAAMVALTTASMILSFNWLGAEFSVPIV